MPVSTPPQLVAFGTNVVPDNIACATWTPLIGPRPCDFLVAFVQSESTAAVDDPVFSDELSPGSGPWIPRAGVHSHDCTDCGCNVSLFAYTKMVQTAEPDGLTFCAEWETVLECMLVEVYRFTGVSKLNPVVQIDVQCGCADGIPQQITMPDAIQSQPGLVSFMGLATNLCSNLGTEFNGGDDFWNFSDEQSVCPPGGFTPNASALDTQWAEVDAAGGDLPVNAYLGAGFFGIRKAEYAAINMVLAPGECSFTPPVVPDTAHGGSLSVYPKLPTVLNGRGRVGVTTTSSYRFDLSGRQSEQEAEAARILDLW